MKIADYMPGFGRESVKMDVLKEHVDGTVDLGIGGVLKVGKCPLSDSAKIGHCTIKPAQETKK